MNKLKRKLIVNIPTPDEFKRGYLAFRDKERRDAMYKTATFLVEHFWRSPAEIANSLGVLLLTWNQAHFRYGSFDFLSLEKVLRDKQLQLDSFRHRDIFSYVAADDPAITSLFNDLLTALQICEGAKKGAKSPVAVAKALHLLAPGYFPLWDKKIASTYKCGYSHEPAGKYLLFFGKMKHFAEQLAPHREMTGDFATTLLKVIDEYNYAKYTKSWI